jgi:hypothetical protein
MRLKANKTFPINHIRIQGEHFGREVFAPMSAEKKPLAAEWQGNFEHGISRP